VQHQLVEPGTDELEVLEVAPPFHRVGFDGAGLPTEGAEGPDRLRRTADDTDAQVRSSSNENYRG
jgi:hypothetical protein